MEIYEDSFETDHEGRTRRIKGGGLMPRPIVVLWMMVFFFRRNRFCRFLPSTCELDRRHLRGVPDLSA